MSTIFLNPALQAFIVIVGIGLNALFLVQVQYQKKKLNKSDTLLVIKTTCVLLSLLLYAPFEVYFTITKHAAGSICIVKDILEAIAMGTLIWSMLALAFVRLRVSRCKGNADLLLSNRLTVKVYAGCIIIPILSSIGLPLLTYGFCNLGKQNDFIICGNYCKSLSLLNLTSSIVVDVIPLILIIAIYFMIYQHVSRYTKTEMESTRKYVQSIMTTVVLLLSSLFVTWIPYVTLKNVLYYTKANDSMKTVYTYVKISVLLSHPIAEGMFSKKQRECFKIIKNKLGEKISPKQRKRRILSSKDDESEVFDDIGCDKTQKITCRRRFKSIDLENGHFDNFSFQHVLFDTAFKNKPAILRRNSFSVENVSSQQKLDTKDYDNRKHRGLQRSLSQQNMDSGIYSGDTSNILKSILNSSVESVFAFFLPKNVGTKSHRKNSNENENRSLLETPKVTVPDYLSSVSSATNDGYVFDEYDENELSILSQHC